MKIVLLKPRKGDIVVEDIPRPQAMPGRVLINNAFSLISAGTERATVQVGQQSLIGKARRRPDQAKQVLQTVRQLGPLETYRIVSDRLDAPMLLGYSSAGTVIDVGEGVDDLRPGMLVAAGGGGYACHAEVVSVPKNLCVPVPDGVSPLAAAFSTVGAIALQGIHQADVLPGSRVAVIGLGLVGQLTVRILKAYGYDVIGIDRDETMLALADAVGVTAVTRDTEGLLDVVKRRWGGELADAVLITAATQSTDPVELGGQLARDRATVVIVGDVNVAPPRSSYYGKELSIRYSRSYGPGRYDHLYEEGGVDYPIGFVPWPQRRNMAEFVRLVSVGLDLDSLNPVAFNVERAAEAYALLEAKGADRRVAILLSYPQDAASAPPRLKVDAGEAAQPVTSWAPLRAGTAARFAAVGAGSFATRMLFPHLKKDDDACFTWITTSGGLTAAYQGRRWGFTTPLSGIEEGLASGDADCVVVSSRHDSHAHYATEVLSRGVGLFVEKPLALDESGLEAVADAWLTTGAPAMVGFNRRFAPAVKAVKHALGSRSPMQVVYRVFAGKLSPDHWLFDDSQGGRVLGEVCHFIDTAGYLIGAKPTSVFATTADGSADPVRTQSVSVHLTYDDGSAASVVYGGLTPPGAPKELIEVAANGLAARIDDFGSLSIWSDKAHKEIFKGGPKGHAEEMRALVRLLHGESSPETDFVNSLWSSLVTCRAVESVRQGKPVLIDKTTPRLAAALGLDTSG